jgi:RimJ/RimL family protein N-acetyltransferase
MLIDHFPPAGLRLTTGRLELRLPSLEELAQLADLAADGVHEPGMMPFTVPWTDQSPAERAQAVVLHHWATLGKWTPQSWELPFTVFRDGTVVGQQNISGKDFAVIGECSTGSWLGLRYHRQGIGSQMRAAVIHLAFAGLGAAEVVSTAYVDNPASLGVSAKLGYTNDGIARHAVQGRLRISRRLRLTRAAWEQHERVPVTIEGLAPCLSMLGI